MFAYRFKVSFELNDEFLREMELKTSQNFLDFYNILLEDLQVDKNKESAFFLCDHKFRKKKPIKSSTENNPSDENSSELVMEKCILADYVDDPHQKFLFIYDLPNDWNFYIELIKITPTQTQFAYPRIVKAIGPTPVEISRKNIVLPEDTADDMDEEMLDNEMAEFAELEDVDNLDEDSSAEENLYDEEDLDELNDDSFYNDSMDSGSDLDESRQ